MKKKKIFYFLTLYQLQIIKNIVNHKKHRVKCLANFMKN